METQIWLLPVWGLSSFCIVDPSSICGLFTIQGACLSPHICISDNRWRMGGRGVKWNTLPFRSLSQKCHMILLSLLCCQNLATGGHIMPQSSHMPGKKKSSFLLLKKKQILKYFHKAWMRGMTGWGLTENQIGPSYPGEKEIQPFYTWVQ